MSRPAKPIQASTQMMTKENRAARIENETKLKGSKAVSIPAYLSKDQKAIAAAIIDALSQADILSSLDETIIALAAFSIDGITKCIKEQQDDPFVLDDSNYRQKLKKLEETFEKACRELGLSPQARAKIAIASQNTQENSTDVLKKIIGGKK